LLCLLFVIISNILFVNTGLSQDTKVNENLRYELVSNKIIVESPEPIIEKEALILSLNYFLLQKPNRKKFWNPRDWFDRSPPVIHDPDLSDRSAIAIQKSLRNKKGFYNAVVTWSSEMNTDGGVKIKYQVDLGRQYKVRSFIYHSDDKQLEKLVKSFGSENKIKPGTPLDATIFETEKNRIVSKLQNLGYANFVTNYIEIIGRDSSNFETEIVMHIQPPLPDSTHTQYSIGDINVYTEHLPNDSIINGKNRDYFKQNYIAKGEEFVVKPKVISQALYLKKGDLFKKENRLKSFRQLSKLSAYRYIDIKPTIDSEQDSIIDFDVFLTPHEKKWIWDAGSDVFYSTINQLGNRLFGFGVNSGLQNRNFLGGSELFATNLEGTLELNLPDSISSVGIQFQNSLKIPRYVDLLGFSKSMRALQILRGERYKKFREEATSEIRASYSFTRIINNYTIQAFGTSWGYDYRHSNHGRFIIQQLGLNYLNPEPIPGSIFEETLNRNPLLRSSFEPVLSTGFLFRDITYLYQGPENKKGVSFGLLAEFEMSGVETFGLNRLVNAISGSEGNWEIDGVEFARYFKIGFDGKMYKKLANESSFAFRFASGIAFPFGENGVVPFTSQYFVGGPNSIRAWQIRELGPGAHSELLLNPVDDQPFFQTGNFKLEFNIEYRKHLFWYFEGALFIDAGNVWTLEEDFDRFGAQLSSSFLDEIAVGFGYGLRLDFDYFIIRFDFGFKLRNPFPDQNGSHNALNKAWNSFPFGNINIAINHPF